MADIGELNANTKELDIDWRIQNFSSLPKKIDEYYSSPIFYFAGASWCLDIYPYGSIIHGFEGFIGLYICRKSAGPAITLDCSISLKILDGKKYGGLQFTFIFSILSRKAGYLFYLSRSELLRRQSNLMPLNVLTVSLVCTVTDICSAKCPGNIGLVKCSYCQESLNGESVLVHKTKCINKPMKCSLCSKDVLSHDLLYHECQTDGAEGDISAAECSYSTQNLDSEKNSSNEKTCTNKPTRCSKCSSVVSLEESEHQTTRTDNDESLTQDYKKVLLEGKNHDLILKIGDNEFRAHQDILRARSPVFQSMLDHDMKEKKSGIIDVPDCDPQAMQVFLSYVYCGEVESLALDQSNMLELYYVADKYDMKGLKDYCCKFIKTSLSTTNFCDIIQLAVRHCNAGLLEHATEYFMKNALDIMRTVEWQSFLKDNSTVGNELLIKSFEKLKM